MPFFDLPDEVLLFITAQIDITGLFSFRRVRITCKDLVSYSVNIHTVD